MKHFIFSLIFFAIINSIYAKYLNEVVDPVPASVNGNVYKFELTITHGLTMSLYSPVKEMFTPTIYNEQEKAFYLMDTDLTKPCNAMNKMTNQTEIDSIITASGVSKQIILINGMFPGPPIVVPKDANVEITVRNKLMTDIVTIHWHGQVQKGTFFHDGVSGLTQCPIVPGESYTYKFVATKSGTHWYHAHSGLLRSEGVYGPFIVKEAASTSNTTTTISNNSTDGTQNTTTNSSNTNAAYEKEFYLILQEWFHDDSLTIYNTITWRNLKYFSPNSGLNSCAWRNRMDDGTNLPPVPLNAVLINGKGWHNISTNESDINDNVFDLPLEEYVVQPNKKYLFRVISATMSHPLEIRVSGHQMVLVGTDGNKIKPINNVDTLIIHSGERYDFEIHTKAENESGNFLIVAKSIQKYDFTFQKVQTQLFGIARLHYNNTERKNINSDYTKNCTNDDPCIVANCYHAYNNLSKKCISADKFESYSEISNDDKQILKTEYAEDEIEEYFLNFVFTGDPITRASVNQIRFERPSVPPFFKKNSSQTIVNCPERCTTIESCKCTHKIQVKPGKIIQLNMLTMGKTANVNNVPHPIHLHGHHFYVMKMGFPKYDLNGFVFGNNDDINCSNSDPNFCNSVNWSNKNWSYGNVSNMSLSPALKDTIFIPMGGYVVARFRSDNIGIWFLHCHLENHVTEGMSLYIQEGSDEEIRNIVKWDEINTCSGGHERTQSIQSTINETTTSLPHVTLSTIINASNITRNNSIFNIFAFIIFFYCFCFNILT